MSATATQQVIHNGTRNLVLKYTIDGAFGDVSAAQLVDLAALDSSVGTDRLKLVKAKWALTGMSCKLAWDGAPDVDLLEMNSSGEVNFCGFGGVVNNAVEQTGDVKFTTTGYGTAGDGGHFTLWFKKRDIAAAISGIEPGAGALALAGLVPDRTELP